jgi:hypothetical protein
MMRRETAELTITVLGVVGMLGYFLAGRLDDLHSSPFDVFALVWFLTFGVIKASLPLLIPDPQTTPDPEGDTSHPASRGLDRRQAGPQPFMQPTRAG